MKEGGREEKGEEGERNGSAGGRPGGRGRREGERERKVLSFTFYSFSGWFVSLFIYFPFSF